MADPYRSLIPAMWLAWAVYWWVSSRNVKPVLRHESLSSRFSHIAPLVLALLFFSAPGQLLRERFLPVATWTFPVAVIVTAAGLGFAVWARRCLGTNWSGTVTIKQDHELVTSGPYALARHPIYTGLLLAFIGSAIARGEWRCVLAVALATLAFWRKLRIEERWMYEQFGDVYRAYCQRVRALIPFVL